MKRREVLSVRYLTFSCYQQLPLLGRRDWRDVFARHLAAARERCGFRLLAWVVMPEHVHLILVPGAEVPVPRILCVIKQPIAQRAIRRWREADAAVLDKITLPDGRCRFWQAGGGFDRNVRDTKELGREIVYIHNNPVRRGLVEAPTDWAWSSARWYAGQREGQVAVDPVIW